MRPIPITIASLFLAVTVHAQTIEQITFTRLYESPMSVRSAAMGGATDPAAADVSLIDLNPAAVAGLQRAAFSASAASRDEAETTFSHLSVAAPFGDFVLGGYYRREPDLESAQRFSGISPAASPYQPLCPTCLYLFPVRDAAFAQRDTRYGVTAAWSRGNFAIGAGAELRDLDRRHELARTSISPNTPLFVEERVLRHISGRSIVPSAGITWRATPRVSLAASYNGSGSFDRTTSACGVANIDAPACNTVLQQLNESTVEMPDSYRAGGSFRATDRLTLAAEAVRRNYSSLSHEPYSLIGSVERLPFFDVTELHAGAELTIRNVALRAGWWRDPARSEPLAERLASPIAGETDQDHVTAGLGLLFGSARVDVSYDHAGDDGGHRAAIALTLR